MRVFIFNKIPFFVIITVLIFTITIGLPAVGAISKISTETRDYWEGSNDIIWQVNTNEKMIALTFDDGPSATFTPKVLDILKKNNVHGTFFVIAHEVEKYPDIVRRMVYEGNEIANHTYNHKYLNRFSREDLREELKLAETTIMEASGFKPRLFRPPGGYYNKDIVEVSKEQGYRVIIWSWEQQSGDWANPGIGTIIRRVLKNAESGNIVVLHDRGGDRNQTIRALQPIIDGLKKRGFKVVTVSEMLESTGKNGI